MLEHFSIEAGVSSAPRRVFSSEFLVLFYVNFSTAPPVRMPLDLFLSFSLSPGFQYFRLSSLLRHLVWYFLPSLAMVV